MSLKSSAGFYKREGKKKKKRKLSELKKNPKSKEPELSRSARHTSSESHHTKKESQISTRTHMEQSTLLEMNLAPAMQELY